MKDVNVAGTYYLDALQKITEVMTPEDFEFSIQAAGYDWDVYKFTANGKLGQMAFRITDEKTVVVSYWGAGGKTPDEIVAFIERAAKKEAGGGGRED